jgi:hypothetical protein
LYITGAFWDTVSLGSHILVSNGRWNSYLVKYDANGNILWVKTSSTPSNSCWLGFDNITIDSFGNLYITGTVADTAYFGSLTFTGNTSDAYLMKCDTSGNPIWSWRSKAASTNSYAVPHGIITDNAGSIYINGDVIDTNNFGSTRLIGGVACDIFFAKYSPSGNLIWAKQSHHDSSAWHGYSLDVDKNNNIFFSGGGGFGNDSIVFLNDTLGITYPADASILMKLDTSAKVLCSSIIRTGGEDNNCVVCDPSGKYIYLGGDISDTITFGNDHLAPIGELPFVARWQPCSNPNTEAISNIQPIKEAVTLYPNPNNGRFTIKLQGVRDKEQVEIYNMLGEKIYSSALSIHNSTFSIDLGTKPAGVYLYRVTNETGTLLGEGKFIIQR